MLQLVVQQTAVEKMVMVLFDVEVVLEVVVVGLLLEGVEKMVVVLFVVEVVLEVVWLLL